MLLLCGASRTEAQPAGLGPAGLGANPDSALAQQVAAIPGTPIDLEEAVQLALQNATVVRDAAAVVEAARGAARRERGAFDPELFADYAWSKEHTPSSSPFLGSELDQRNSTAGARVQLGTGTEIEASLGTLRTETNSSFTTLNPAYQADGRITITQPLLKGLGPGTRSDLSAAEHDLEAARFQYENTVLVVRATVEELYWDLYALARDLAVERLIRDRAVRFLDETQKRARAGLVGPIQVANAQVFLAEEEQAVLDRQEQMDTISDRLATFLGRRPDPGVPRFRPTAEPPSSFQLAPQDTVVQLALRHNQGLRVVERHIESVRASARGAGWQALPDLDAFGSLGGNGLSGTPRDVVFGSDTVRTTLRKGGATDAWDQVFGRDFPTWELGVRFTLPIGLRADRGERDRLRAEVVRAEQELIAAQRSLEEDVRRRVRELENAERRVGAAQSGVSASIEQVRIGLLDFQAGRTTAFELVRLAADVASAQRRYSEALVRGAKAAAELRYLTAGRYPAARP